MDFVVDKVDYSVSEFFESFGHNLPKVTIVTQGFFGEIVDDTFDKDQVYRIHTTSRQKRIIAKSTDRHYSIPLNYPLKLCVVKKHGKSGKEQTLKDIINEHAFPIDVKFAGDQEFSVGSSRTCTNRFPQLRLVDIFDEVYFLANTIIDGVIDLKVVPIPLYLSLLRLAEITGIKDQSQEKWRRYTSELNDLVTSSVEFDLTFGNKDIAEYHQESFKADTVYTYIEPRTYSNIFSVNQFQPTRGPSKDLTVHDAGNVYEEIQKTNRKSDVMIPLAEMGGELKSFFQEKQRASVLGRPVPSVPGGGGGDSNATNGDSSKEQKKNPTPSIPKRDPSTKVSSSGTRLPPKPPKPNPYVNEIPRGTVTPTTQPDQKTLRKPPEPVAPKPQPGKLPAAPPAAPPPPTGNQTSSAISQNVDNDPAGKDFDVEKLSMKELAECMTSLKLSKYTSQFQEHMIDGTILKEIDAELLKSDFGFTSIEAIRLIKFAKEGHIPK